MDKNDKSKKPAKPAKKESVTDRMQKPSSRHSNISQRMSMPRRYKTA